MSKKSPHVLYLTDKRRRSKIPRGFELNYAIRSRSGLGDISIILLPMQIGYVDGSCFEIKRKRT